MNKTIEKLKDTNILFFENRPHEKFHGFTVGNMDFVIVSLHREGKFEVWCSAHGHAMIEYPPLKGKLPNYYTEGQRVNLLPQVQDMVTQRYVRGLLNWAAQK